VFSLKKLIAMAACATLVMSSISIAADSFVSNNKGIDVVSAATGETTPAPAKSTTTTKSTTTKSTTTKSTTTATKPTTPSTPVSKYKDGFYTAYGDSSAYGSEKAEITIKNGKLTAVKLYKLLPDLSDGQTTYYYKQAPQAAPVMAGKFIKKGTSFTTMTTADVVTGATSSSKNWNVAVSRALEKASATSKLYFDGTFGGVDTESKILVLCTLKDYKLTKVSTYILDTKGHVVIDSALTPTQKEIVASINTGLLKSGMRMKDIKGAEYYTQAAKAAYMNALVNASTNQVK
jgi:uncharacterized protein with FMN-binding domain